MSPPPLPRHTWPRRLAGVATILLAVAPGVVAAQAPPERVGIIRGRRLPVLPRRAARMEARGEILAVPLGSPAAPRPAAPLVRTPPRAAAPTPAAPAAGSAQPGPLATNLLNMARSALPGLLENMPAKPVPPGAAARQDPAVQQAARVTAEPRSPAAPPAPSPRVAPSAGSLAAVTADAARGLLVGRAEPFTAAWYSAHPQAWRDDAAIDWWQGPTDDRLAAWLATASATPSVWTVDGQIVAALPPQADGTRSVLVEEPREGRGAADSWLPLGVYAAFPADATEVADGEGPEPLAWQQLAIGHDGSIRGNHYDAIADLVRPITGRIDPRTRQATWSVGGGRGARFEAAVDALTAPVVDVRAMMGETARPWSLARLAKPAPLTVDGEAVELLPAPGR